MSSRWPTAEQIEQVHELNRAFLRYLQTCAHEGLDMLDLPLRAKAVLAATRPEVLDGIAQFPCSLFRLNIEEDAGARRTSAAQLVMKRNESMRHSVSLAILMSAWTFSRQSACQARLLLGMDLRTIARLRGAQVTDLQDLALQPRLVLCAFPAWEWLWIELLTETRPEIRRQLALIALQPGLEHGWPVSRVTTSAPAPAS